MKRRTDILTHLLLLLLVLVACTADDAIKENLSHQNEYVTVRMHIPGMKAVATRAAEADNITSIVALVFRNDQLQSVTEYTADSTLHPISPISGTITIDKPKNGDVIHFLANLPANYSDGVPYVEYLAGFIKNQNKTQEDVLRNLSSRDYDKLSYWGMATRNENNAVMDVMLYRNKAMIEIKPGADCTFRQDELFIAGLDNPNNVGLLVPYNGGFNFDLDNNDYLTLPDEPDPLDKTDELTNYGAGYDNAYYVFEHANPNDEHGLYVICKIGDDYYKVALHDEKGQPYHIIRNHKYTILVNDLDAGCKTYSDALSAEPIKPTVIETKDVTFSYTDNATVYLNGGASSTLPVEVTIPSGASLTQFSIETYNNFDATASGGTLTPTDNGYTYAGGSATFTFIPKNAGDYTIQISGSGNNLNDFSRSINVKVDATVMSVVAKNSDSEINMDKSETSATLVLTKPGNVGNVNVSVSSDVFNYSVNGNEYTFTPKNNNIASGSYTVTFSDANYPDKVNCSATITVVNTPKVTFSVTGSQTIQMNGTPFTVTMNVPDGKSLSEFGITVTPATGLNVTQGGNQLTLNNGVYSTNAGVSGTQTFTFAPTAAGTYTITFSGSGTDVNMPQESERTINLTVNAAAVTTMSATAVNDDSTIDLDSGDTNVTFTLTKPSSVGQLNIGVKDANSTNVKNNFSITADGQSPWNNNDNQDDGYYYNVNNNSETVTITVALKNGFNTAGTYTITISDYIKTMSTTATITIKKTPTVSFSNTSDKILYWHNGNPTSFDVEMTGVPDGKNVTLSITNASAFTITLPNGNTVSDTYTGGNTTFTITPKDVGSVNETTPYSITFRDADDSDGVKVPEIPISVKVMNERPAVQEIVLWGDKEGEGNTSVTWGGFSLSYEVIKDYAGKTILIDIVTDNDDDYKQLRFKVGDNEFGSIEGNEKLPRNVEKTIEVTLPNDLAAGFKITGDGVVFKKFYYVPND